jgi:DNA-binding HxlR family transcriptional regulator
MELTTPEPIHVECRRFSGVLSLIGNKWTVMIVLTLTERPRRFNDIKRTIGGISQQMLARTLRALERDGMVARTVHPTVPPQVEYALTDLGRSLADPIRELGCWAGAHIAEIETNRSAFDEARDSQSAA